MARTSRTSKKDAGKATGSAYERPAWPDRFLTALRNKGTISGAAKVADVGRRTVYDEMDRNPDFKRDVYEILDECVDLVESTLFEQALLPDNTTDRIFYLKSRRPEVFGDKLRQDQVDKIREEARQEAVAEIDRQLQQLPAALQQQLMEALAPLAKTNPQKELTP